MYATRSDLIEFASEIKALETWYSLSEAVKALEEAMEKIKSLDLDIQIRGAMSRPIGKAREKLKERQDKLSNLLKNETIRNINPESALGVRRYR